VKQPGPWVDVIIPCYNQGHFLAEAIESVLGQTYPRARAIVIDDGSTDNTREVAGRYTERVRYVWKENAGLPAARNSGIMEADGEFLLFLDSDDYLRPNMLERQITVACTAPAGAVFHGGWEDVDVEGRSLARFEAETLPADTFHAIMGGCPYPCHVVMIRRDLFANVGLFDTGLRSCEDWDMWLRIAAAGHRFVAVPGAIAAYRRYPGSMSKNRERMWHSSLSVLQKNRAAHGRCALCRQAFARSARQFREWYFEHLVHEIYACKVRGETRDGFAKAARLIARDPVLIGWFARELFRYLRGAHARTATPRAAEPISESQREGGTRTASLVEMPEITASHVDLTSPEGATVGSQGREPLVERSQNHESWKGGRPFAVAGEDTRASLSPFQGSHDSHAVSRELAPLATHSRPFGANDTKPRR
jgi:glycosyltransferase involved in cell wall biosynthesis